MSVSGFLRSTRRFHDAGMTLLVFGGLLMASAPGSQAAEPLLDDIRAILIEQYSSIRTMDVKFSENFESAIPEKIPSRNRGKLWCIDGDKYFHSNSLAPESPDWDFRAFDGTWTQTGILDSWDSRQVRFVNRMRGYQLSEDKANVYAISWGLSMGDTHQTLAAALESPGSKLLRPEDLDGHPCWVVESGPCQMQLGPRLLRYTVWLDRELNWLPRRLICTIHPDCPDYERVRSHYPDGAVHEYRNLEFQFFPDPLLGRERPLPVKTELRLMLGNSTYTIESLNINNPIDPDRFVIQPTPGTKVREGSHLNDPKTRTWIHGGPQQEAKDLQHRIEQARVVANRARQQLESARKDEPQNSALVDATPRRPRSRLSWFLGAGACCSIGTAIWLSRRP